MQLESLKCNEIADQALALLRYFLEKLNMQKIDYDYCNTLRLRIISFIRFVYPQEVEDWDHKKVIFVKATKQLNKKMVSESKRLWEMLKKPLKDSGLLIHNEIKEACDKLESLLEFRLEGSMFFGAAEPIVKGLIEVFFAITKYGSEKVIEDLQIKKYVERFSKMYEYDENNIPIPIQHIGLFNTTTFVPSYFQLWDLYDEFIASAAGAWDRLCGIEWGWSKPRREVFRRKKFDYNSLLTVTRSAQYVVERSHWQTIKTVRTSLESKKNASLSEVRLEGIKLQVQAVREQARDDLSIIFNVLCGKDTGQIEADYMPKGMRLTIENEDKELRLIIQWDYGICEVKHCHNFHVSDEKNVRLAFFKGLIENPGIEISINPVNGAHAEKFLCDVGISGPLDKVLVLSKKGDRASLRSDAVDFQILPNHLVRELRDYVDDFETVEWRHMIR